MIDAHHHLWNLDAVNYPWLMAQGVERFFGDPTPIQRNYLLDEFRQDAAGFRGSVHIQVGAENPMAEALWVQKIADENPDWPMAQVVFCDLTASDLDEQLDRYQQFSTVRGVRQIVGRAPEEDLQTGSNALLSNPQFAKGLRLAGTRGLSFDLQLIPELYSAMTHILDHAPDTPIALCHAGSPHDRSTDGLKSWAKELKQLSQFPSVTCKLSGLGMFDHNWTDETIRPIIETCLEQFGQNRCMFGSNFPVDSLYSSYEKIASSFRSVIPSHDHEQVFQTTAQQFYTFDNLDAGSV